MKMHIADVDRFGGEAAGRARKWQRNGTFHKIAATHAGTSNLMTKNKMLFSPSTDGKRVRAGRARLDPMRSRQALNRRVAATSSCTMPGSVMAWPASGTMRRSACGQARVQVERVLERRHDVVAAVHDACREMRGCGATSASSWSSRSKKPRLMK